MERMHVNTVVQNCLVLVLAISLQAIAFSQESTSQPTAKNSTKPAPKSVIEPIEFTKGSDVTPLLNWIKAQKIPRGGRMRAIINGDDITILQFRIPHDNLAFEFNYATQTKKITSVHLGFGGVKTCRFNIQVDKLTINSDTSYSITMLPISLRAYHDFGSGKITPAKSVPSRAAGNHSHKNR